MPARSAVAVPHHRVRDVRVRKSEMSDVRQNSASVPEGIASVLERISDAVVALDRNWIYTYVNDRAARIFGRTPADLIGKHI